MSPDEAKQLVFNYWDYFQHMAHKRFPYDNQLAEQAIDYMLEKLEKNNWRRVCDYNGAGFTAYITVVVNRLFTDFARKTGESPVIPAWVSKRGPRWQKIWLMLYKGMSRHEIIDTLSTNDNQQTESTASIVNAILSRNPPRSAPSSISLDASDMETLAADNIGSSPPEALSDQENNSLLEALFQIIHDLQLNTSSALKEHRSEKWLQRLQMEITLSSEEYLFLAMVYRDGLTVSEAGRRLQMSVNQAQGRHRRLLHKLQDAFEHCGLNDELRLLLE